MSTNSGWKAGLREFLIIVAGVLAALAGQSIWEYRDDRRRERDYLRQLLEETRQNERRLSDAYQQDSAVLTTQSQIVRALLVPGPLPPDSTMMAWIGRASSSSDLQLLTGTYEAMVSAGDLRLLRNDTLRAQVVRYAAALEHGQTMLRVFMQEVVSNAGAFSRAMPFIRDIFIEDRTSLPPRRYDFTARRSDPELGALLFTLQAMHNNRVNYLYRMLNATRAARQVLEAEPGLEGER